MTKTYDRSYFDKWYRSVERVHDRGEVRRKASLAISIAEYFLRRRIETVLDIGCGEGAWLRHIRSIRPRAEYTGIDASEYAVAEFGAERNIRLGRFGDLPSFDFQTPFDLVVCSDVLHYVPDGEIRRGVPSLARLTGGVAFVEVLTAEDEIIGDLEGLIRRPAEWYRKVLSKSRLVGAGPYCWLSPWLKEDVSELERC